MAASYTDAAGVYWVMAKLNSMGKHCAPTFRGAPHIDIMVSNENGSRSVNLQVKTARNARRYRGHAPNKVLHHCEWTMGEKCYSLNSEHVWFALVDLRDSNLDILPDVYLVPSVVIQASYNHVIETRFGGEPNSWKWKRYHPLIDELPQPNNWADIEALL